MRRRASYPGDAASRTTGNAADLTAVEKLSPPTGRLRKPAPSDSFPTAIREPAVAVSRQGTPGARHRQPDTPTSGLDNRGVRAARYPVHLPECRMRRNRSGRIVSSSSPRSARRRYRVPLPPLATPRPESVPTTSPPRSGLVQPQREAVKPLPSRQLTGASRPGASGAGTWYAYRDGAGNCRAGCPPSAVTAVCSLSSSRWAGPSATEFATPGPVRRPSRQRAVPLAKRSRGRLVPGPPGWLLDAPPSCPWCVLIC